MPNYARDIDIGKPKVDPVSVTILNTETIIGVKEAVEESIEELRKIRTGQELILGGEIEEE